MWCKININVAYKLGYPAAILLEHIDNINPTNNKAKLNISDICRTYKIPLNTGYRVISALVSMQYLIKTNKHYALGDKFYEDFPEYTLKPHSYE